MFPNCFQNYAGNPKNFICRNCNCYPHLFRCCSTIKFILLFSTTNYLALKNLSVALLNHFIHCSVFTVQTRRSKLHSLRFQLTLKVSYRFVASPLQNESASLGFVLSGTGTLFYFFQPRLKPDFKVQLSLGFEIHIQLWWRITGSNR